MKQTPTKKQRTKAPVATPPPAKQQQQPLTPIDIMRGVVQQFDKLQQEHAKLVEQFTTVAYVLSLFDSAGGEAFTTENKFREAIEKYKVTINPVIKDGLVIIETSLQPL